MKMVLETDPNPHAKDLPWLKAKWWFRLFNVALWIASVLLALFVVLGTFAYVSEGCHAATLDPVETYNWGKSYPADSAKTTDLPPKALEVAPDGSVPLKYKSDNSDDPLGLLDGNPGTVTADGMARDYATGEERKDYWCVMKALFMCAIGISVIFALRKGVELLFVYIAIGDTQD